MPLQWSKHIDILLLIEEQNIKLMFLSHCDFYIEVLTIFKSYWNHLIDVGYILIRNNYYSTRIMCISSDSVKKKFDPGQISFLNNPEFKWFY